MQGIRPRDSSSVGPFPWAMVLHSPDAVLILQSLALVAAMLVSKGFFHDTLAGLFLRKEVKSADADAAVVYPL